MSVETSVVIRILEELAPAGLAESWDNSGFQLGDPGAAINRVLTLDVTAAVAAEASERGAELIVSHHPLFF